MRPTQLIALLLLVYPLALQATDTSHTLPLDESPQTYLGEELSSRRKNINHLTQAELMDIPGVSSTLADSIIAFRTRYGPFLSPYELTYIPQIDPQKAQYLLQFIRIEPPMQGLDSSLFARQQLDATQRIAYRIPLSKRPPTHYRSDRTKPQGTDLRLMTRITYQVGRWLKVGLKGAKVSGEPFLRAFNPYGYGWYSAYAQISPATSPLKRIVAGSFTLTTGYGLTHSSTAMRWPNYHTQALAQRSVLPRGVLEFQGADYPKGIATTLGLPRGIWLTAAYAIQRINARLDTAKSPPAIITRNPQSPTTTYAQLANRRSSWQQQGIVDLHRTTAESTLGVTAMLLHNQHPFLHPYPMSRGEIIPPRTFWRTGLYARVKTGELELFGETSLLLPDQNLSAHNLSTYLGLSLPLLPRLTLGAYYYAYGGHTIPLYAYSHAITTTPINCQGATAILEFRPSYQSGIHARYQTEMPGINPLKLHHTKERRKLRIWAYYAEDPSWRSDITYSLSTQQAPERFTTPPITLRHHLHASYRRILAPFTLAAHLLANATRRHRAPHNRYGYAIALDAHYEHPKCHLKGRIAYHDARRSQSPLYIYEPAPRYSFSIGMLSRRAIKAILLLEYRPIHELRLTIHAAKSFYLSNSLSNKPRLKPRDRVLKEGLDLQVQVQYRPKF